MGVSGDSGGPEGHVSAARSGLQALLAGQVLADAEAAAHLVGVSPEVLGEAALARRAREQPAAVIAAHEPGPTLLRALRERPPALLIVTGPELPAGLGPARVLGPEARVVLGGGQAVVTAPDPATLHALLAALAADGEADPAVKPRLALCPVPGWLPGWLTAPELAGCPAAGLVPASSLHAGWVAPARRRGPAQVLVPLGLEAPRVDTPRHPSLGPAAAAHALERLSGPVFPSPRALALLLRGLGRESRRTGSGGQVQTDRSVGPGALALWNQARRALPLTGAGLGMEAPHPDLPLASPTDAFLAQRALLRHEQSQELVRAAELGPPTLDPAAVRRAEEVLRSAGLALSEHESKVVLKGFGIEITRQAVASSASGAAQYADQIGYPVVLKAVSPDLRRKQELGAVVLDLANGAAVRRAYSQIVAAVEQQAPTAHLDGILVCEQIPEGLEVHCGAVALAGGELALFGRALGLPLPGEYTLCLSPLTVEEALLFAQAILARVPVPALRRRGDPNVRELAGLFLRLDALARHFGAAGLEGEGRLELVDLSPVRLVGPPRGYVTLDARIVQRPHLEGI